MLLLIIKKNFLQLRLQLTHSQQFMIVLRHYRFRLQFPTQYLFSSIKNKQYSLSAQRSVLATAIINEIASSQPPTDFNGLSLRERILKLSPSIEGREVSQQAKDGLFALFTRGVTLDYELYNLRVVEQPQQPNQCFKFLKKKKPPSNFIFFPTYLCTQPMFNILLETREEQQKEKGVVSVIANQMGKTISFVLYAQISKFIHQFYFQAQENQQSRAEFQDLTEKKLISMVPKCWYWLPNERQRKFKETQNIYRQTTELPSEKRKILSSKLDDPIIFQQHLRKLYPQGIQKKLIVDQANQMTDLASSFNNREFQKICDAILGKSHYYSQRYYYEKYSFKKLLSQFCVLKRFADSSLFLLSEPIQNDLFQASKSRKVGLGQKFIKSVDLGCKRALQNEKWATVDFWQYFWFQHQRIIKAEIEISQIRRLFFENCAENQVKIKPSCSFLEVYNQLQNTYLYNFSYPKSLSTEQIRKRMFKQRARFMS